MSQNTLIFLPSVFLSPATSGEGGLVSFCTTFLSTMVSCGDLSFLESFNEDCIDEEDVFGNEVTLDVTSNPADVVKVLWRVTFTFLFSETSFDSKVNLVFDSFSVFVSMLDAGGNRSLSEFFKFLLREDIRILFRCVRDKGGKANLGICIRVICNEVVTNGEILVGEGFKEVTMELVVEGDWGLVDETVV